MGSLAIRLAALFVLIAIANLMFVELVIVNGVIFASVGIAFAAFVKDRGREYRYRAAVSGRGSRLGQGAFPFGDPVASHFAGHRASGRRGTFRRVDTPQQPSIYSFSGPHRGGPLAGPIAQPVRAQS